MGGRGASSGVSAKGKPYGSEYHTIFKGGNIKFVKANDGSATAPLETMTRGRVYVTVNAADRLKFISYYDNENKRTKTIDLTKPHKAGEFIPVNYHAPDFSTYTDMPLAMQIYNHYRKHWLAAYWQLLGLTVYPTISWSNEKSYEWCFDGEPVGGVVAVSSVGTQKDKEAKRLFLRGYDEMMKRLSPSWVIFYGNVPEECDWNVIRVKPHYEDIVARREKVAALNEISVLAPAT